MADTHNRTFLEVYLRTPQGLYVDGEPRLLQLHSDIPFSNVLRALGPASGMLYWHRQPLSPHETPRQMGMPRGLDYPVCLELLLDEDQPCDGATIITGSKNSSTSSYRDSANRMAQEDTIYKTDETVAYYSEASNPSSLAAPKEQDSISFAHEFSNKRGHHLRKPKSGVHRVHLMSPQRPRASPTRTTDGRFNSCCGSSKGSISGTRSLETSSHGGWSGHPHAIMKRSAAIVAPPDLLHQLYHQGESGERDHLLQESSRVYTLEQEVSRLHEELKELKSQRMPSGFADSRGSSAGGLVESPPPRLQLGSVRVERSSDLVRIANETEYSETDTYELALQMHLQQMRYLRDVREHLVPAVAMTQRSDVVYPASSL